MVVVAMVLGANGGVGASFHLWRLSELYSNADGTVQFIELTALSGGQQFVMGHTITSTMGGTTQSFTFNANLPGNTAGKTLLIGTAAKRPSPDLDRPIRRWREGDNLAGMKLFAANGHFSQGERLCHCSVFTHRTVVECLTADRHSRLLRWRMLQTGIY